MANAKAKFKKAFTEAMARCGRSDKVYFVYGHIDGVCAPSENSNTILINRKRIKKLNAEQIKAVARHEAFHYVFTHK